MKKILRSFMALALCGAAFVYTGCTDYSEDIDAANARISALEKGTDGQFATVGDQIKALQSTVADLTTAKTNAENQIKALQDKADALQTTVNGLNTTLSALQSKHDADITALNTALEAAKTKESNDVANLQGQITALNAKHAEDVANLNTLITGLSAKVTACENSISALQTSVTTINTTIEGIKADLAKKADKVWVDEVVGNLETEIGKKASQEYVDATFATKQEVTEVATNLGALKGAYEATKVIYDAACKDLEAAQLAITEIKNTMATDADLQDAIEDIQALRVDLTTAQSDIDNLETAVEKAQADATKALTDIPALKTWVTENYYDMAALDEQWTLGKAYIDAADSALAATLAQNKADLETLVDNTKTELETAISKKLDTKTFEEYVEKTEKKISDINTLIKDLDNKKANQTDFLELKKISADQYNYLTDLVEKAIKEAAEDRAGIKADLAKEIADRIECCDSINTKLDNAVKDLNKKIDDINILVSGLEAKVDQLANRVQSIAFVPEFSVINGSYNNFALAKVYMAVGGQAPKTPNDSYKPGIKFLTDAVVEASFMVTPSSMAKTIAENPDALKLYFTSTENILPIPGANAKPEVRSANAVVAADSCVVTYNEKTGLVDVKAVIPFEAFKEDPTFVLDVKNMDILDIVGTVVNFYNGVAIALQYNQPSAVETYPEDNVISDFAAAVAAAVNISDLYELAKPTDATEGDLLADGVDGKKYQLYNDQYVEKVWDEAKATEKWYADYSVMMKNADNKLETIAEFAADNMISEDAITPEFFPVVNKFINVAYHGEDTPVEDPFKYSAEGCADSLAFTEMFSEDPLVMRDYVDSYIFTEDAWGFVDEDNNFVAEVLWFANNYEIIRRQVDVKADSTLVMKWTIDDAIFYGEPFNSSKNWSKARDSKNILGNNSGYFDIYAHEVENLLADDEYLADRLASAELKKVLVDSVAVEVAEKPIEFTFAGDSAAANFLPKNGGVETGYYFIADKAQTHTAVYTYSTEDTDYNIILKYGIGAGPGSAEFVYDTLSREYINKDWVAEFLVKEAYDSLFTNYTEFFPDIEDRNYPTGMEMFIRHSDLSHTVASDTETDFFKLTIRNNGAPKDTDKTTATVTKDKFTTATEDQSFAFEQIWTPWYMADLASTLTFKAVLTQTPFEGANLLYNENHVDCESKEALLGNADIYGTIYEDEATKNDRGENKYGFRYVDMKSYFYTDGLYDCWDKDAEAFEEGHNFWMQFEVLGVDEFGNKTKAQEIFSETCTPDELVALVALAENNIWIAENDEVYFDWNKYNYFGDVTVKATLCIEGGEAGFPLATKELTLTTEQPVKMTSANGGSTTVQSLPSKLINVNVMDLIDIRGINCGARQENEDYNIAQELTCFPELAPAYRFYSTVVADAKEAVFIKCHSHGPGCYEEYDPAQTFDDIFDLECYKVWLTKDATGETFEWKGWVETEEELSSKTEKGLYGRKLNDVDHSWDLYRVEEAATEAELADQGFHAFQYDLQYVEFSDILFTDEAGQHADYSKVIQFNKNTGVITYGPEASGLKKDVTCEFKVILPKGSYFLGDGDNAQIEVPVTVKFLKYVAPEF